MRRHLSAIVLLLVGCSGSPKIRVFPADPTADVAAVGSPVTVAEIRPSRPAMSMTVEGDPTAVELVVVDETTVRICWGNSAVDFSDRAHLRVELDELEARFEEHRLDLSVEPEERGEWNGGKATVLPESTLSDRMPRPDPAQVGYHVRLTLLLDGRYEATLFVTTNSHRSWPHETEIVGHVTGGPLLIGARPSTNR